MFNTESASFLVTTFLLTVLTDLVTAVEAGLVLAVFLFVKRMSDMLNVAKVLLDPQIAVFTVK
ncbi:hypothetical protein [Paenibacillus larvae]|uniref:hypothetical protein n=1 Tax=Paenibacillus larvae TaxID=1464 RepID=UPI001552A61D|nr:hypothetical protein [Paenibacillus larvae]